LPESSASLDLLQEALEGMVYLSPASPEGELAALARACRAIHVPGPSHREHDRLAARIGAITGTGASLAWWQGWLGAPGARPWTQKLAAAALAVGLAGGGASAATGVPPGELAADSWSFVRSVVVNLAPSDNSGTQGPVATETPAATAPAQTPSPQPTAVGTPVPGQATPAPDPTPGTPTASVTSSPAGTPGASATPDDEDDSDDDSKDDKSGSGSSGSDDEPDDDNGGGRPRGSDD